MTNNSLSTETRRNWLIDVILLISGLVASLSGIYFLFLPIGGYQGGRNPMYGNTTLFNRSSWDDIHTWTGIIMITIAVIHILIHWHWVAWMIRRIWNDLFHKGKNINRRNRFNAGINATIGIGFLLTALSAIYLLFFPGGRHGVPDPMFVFTRTTWDLIHTWSAIGMIIAVMIHFGIHWKWVIKVTKKVIRAPIPNLRANRTYQDSKVHINQ